MANTYHLTDRETAAMKIALLVHQFLPHHAAGTEQLTLKIAHELCRRGHDARIITGEPLRNAGLPAIESSTFAGITVFRFVGLGPCNSFSHIQNRRAERLLSKLLTVWRPDIIHAHHFIHVGVGCAAVANKAQIPVVYTPTDFWWCCPATRFQEADGRPCPGPGTFAGRCARHMSALWAERRRVAIRSWMPRVPWQLFAGVVLITSIPGVSLIPMASWFSKLGARERTLARLRDSLSFVFAPTVEVYNALLRAGFPATKMELLPYGIERPVPSAVRPRQHPQITIGFIGTLQSHKGAHLLLEALKMLPSHPCLRVEIYGDPSVDTIYAERLRSLAYGSAHDIVFCGTFPEAEIGDIFAQLDALVVPSLWTENRPLVLLSALMARVPVIVSDQPGLICEVINNKNGLVVPNGDAGALAQALVRISTDRELRRAIARHPKRPKELRTYVDNLYERYTELVKTAPMVRCESNSPLPRP
jgi:glycosyltransferase involved in cell wall biosynthesis